MIDIELTLLMKFNSHSLDSSENALKVLSLQYVQCLCKSCQVITVKVSCLYTVLEVGIEMRKELINVLGSVDLVGTELVGTVGCEGVEKVHDFLSSFLALLGCFGLREKSRLSSDDLLSNPHV